MKKMISLVAAYGIGLAPTLSYAMSWIVVPGPESTRASTSIYGVAVVTDNDVWAVGSKGATLNFPPQALIEHWDGIRWAQVRNPGAELGQGLFYQVAARSSDDIWAVGTNVGDSGLDQTLVEHWNGREWMVVPSPNFGEIDVLHAVCPVSRNDVWAAGTSIEGSHRSYLLLHWNGTEWSRVDAPSVEGSAIQSVKAFASDDVWAVGYKGLRFNASSTLTLHWDGTAWTEVPSPNVGSRNVLEGVDGAAPNDVWAVGSSKLGSFHTVALHWDGTVWNAVPTQVNSLDQVFYAVKVISSTRVYAVGTSSGTPLSARWDGTQWRFVHTPPAAPSAALQSISGRDGTLWAAGTSQNFSFERPNELFLSATP